MEPHDVTAREAIVAQLDAAYAALHAAQISIETAARMFGAVVDSDEDPDTLEDRSPRPPTPQEVRELTKDHRRCPEDAHKNAGVMGNAGRFFCTQYEVFVNSDGSEER